jgi:hypothetical protein
MNAIKLHSKSCEPQHLDDGPNPGNSPDDLGEWASSYHEQIVEGERSLAALYWKLGKALELARKHFTRGQWEKYLAKWKIDKTRASKARKIYGAFQNVEQVQKLSVEKAYGITHAQSSR